MKHLRAGADPPVGDRSPSLRAARQAGATYLLVAAFGFGTSLIPGSVGYHRAGTAVVSAIALVIGVLAIAAGRWFTVRRSLLLAVGGLAIVAASNAIGAVPPIPLGIYFVLIFVWIGQWHAPGTALRFAPLGVVAYLLPFELGAPRSAGAVPSVLLVISVSVLVGEALARQTSAAVRAQREQVAVLEALARASKTDDLTGLGNRRLGNQLLEALATDDAVAVLDLDEFKRVNDHFGHARGDQVLQELGAFLQHEVREADTVARMGGEEFLLVIRGAPASAAVHIVQRLIRGWQQTDPLATLSAGVALHRADQSPSNTYAQADAALYEAKRRGRNRMVLAAGGVAGR